MPTSIRPPPDKINTSTSIGTSASSDITIGKTGINTKIDGKVGINDASPGTLLQLKSETPYITLQNSTSENTDGGCESKIIFEDHSNISLVEFECHHSGTGDDTKGKLILSTHSGSGLVAGLTIDDRQNIITGGTIRVTGNTVSFGNGTTIVNTSGTVLTITEATTAFVGAITATGDITAFSSDKRLKKDILPLENPLTKLQTLSGFTYKWNRDKCKEAGFEPNDEEQIGVFAQDVQAVIPQAVKPAPFDSDGNGGSKSGDNYLTVQYEKIVPLLIESIKEQQEQINSLQERIKSLEKNNE